MKFRPEAEIWPTMNDNQLKVLAADIDANGQLDVISLYNGDILDGRNRWLAITKFCTNGTEPKFEDVTPDSPISFVLSRKNRLDLNDSQRAMGAARAIKMFEEDAAKRMKAGVSSDGKAGGHGRKRTLPPDGGRVSRGPTAAEDAAKASNTSPRNVQRAKFVLENSSAKAQAAVDAGELSLAKAEQIAKEYPDKKRQDAKVAAIKKSKMTTRVKGLTGEFEWYTPRQYLDAAIEVMGAIDLDPASSARAQKHVKAGKFFTIEDDGLRREWAGRVFLNPPYAMPFIKQFVTKMSEGYKKEFEQGILLTNNATDTEWFHLAANSCSSLCFTKGRIKFLEASDTDLIEKTAPTHGQVFFYFGNAPAKFSKVFSKYGIVLEPK